MSMSISMTVVIQNVVLSKCRQMSDLSEEFKHIVKICLQRMSEDMLNIASCLQIVWVSHRLVATNLIYNKRCSDSLFLEGFGSYVFPNLFA